MLLTSITVLEAPNLRDDYYCSVLAYSPTINRLAVGLADRVYVWSEKTGVLNTPNELNPTPFRTAYVTSLAFSSVQGGHAILAVARCNGCVVLWSPRDQEKRFLRITLPSAAVHVSFRPRVWRRRTQRPRESMTEQETLLIGDDVGAISVYFVEWPKQRERHLFGWHGAVALHARIAVHTQQICGIAWTPDGNHLATGGNDNLCCFLDVRRVLDNEPPNKPLLVEGRQNALRNNDVDASLGIGAGAIVGMDGARHQWRLKAAVKALAFCPWQRGLLAAGGGSNDRCIHFYHVYSGAPLATIDCAAQVTSLVWSKTRREIAATFGFAQPEHPYRIAVFAWPSCDQIVAIPWHDEMRALYAIPYPGGPAEGHATRGRGPWWSRTAEEGCIVVAGSDSTIKFHEVWCEARKIIGRRQGILGGSDIIESMHGIEKDGDEVIR